MFTYFFNELHDFRYGKIFNNILKNNKTWEFDSVSDVVTLSDKNSKSKIQLYIDGENNFILKHELAKNYAFFHYVPKTIIITNNIISDDIYKLFKNNHNNIIYLKPSHGRVGSGKDIMLFNNKTIRNENIKKITKKYKYWVIQKEIINPLLFQNRKFAIRFYIVLIHNKNKIFLYSGKICKINVCENEYTIGTIDPKVHISHNENETNDDNQIKFGTKDGIYNVDYIKYDFENMDVLMKKMEYISFDLIIKNSNNFCSNNNIGYRIYGVDFTANKNNEVFLLEVNDNPTLQFGSNKLVNIISAPLLTDVVYLIENMFEKKNKLNFLNFITSFYIKNKCK